MEFGILSFGIWNCTNDWNPEFNLYWQILESSTWPGIDSMESRIQDCPGFPYLWRLSNKMLARVGIMNHNKSHNLPLFSEAIES